MFTREEEIPRLNISMHNSLQVLNQNTLRKKICKWVQISVQTPSYSTTCLCKLARALNRQYPYHWSSDASISFFNALISIIKTKQNVNIRKDSNNTSIDCPIITSGLSCSTCSRTKQSELPLLKEPSYFITKFLPLHQGKCSIKKIELWHYKCCI